MSATHIGYLDFDDKIHRLATARCTFRDGQLDVEAEGPNCKLKLYGIPFPDADSVSDLPGRVFGPDSDTVHSDPIAEGGIELQEDAFLSWESLTVRCKSHNLEDNTLSVSFQADVEDREWGNSGPVDGSVVCEVKDKLW